MDALCIDQHNIDERDDQVMHMKEIYQRCSVDLLWLGKDASMLEEGAAVMERLGSITELENISVIGSIMVGMEMILFHLKRSKRRSPNDDLRKGGPRHSRQFSSSRRYGSRSGSCKKCRLHRA